MGRKREREATAADSDEQPSAAKQTTPQQSVPPQTAFHLPTPRPPAAQSTAIPQQFHLPSPRPVVQSAPAQPQFHLPSPRPPPPTADATPVQPSQPVPQPQSVKPAAVAASAKKQQAAAPPAQAGKKKRKHRRRKATGPPPQPIDRSLPLPAVPSGHFHVFVGGLPYTATKEQVRQHFQRDGCYVWEVRLAQYGSDSGWAGESRGFCHVELENEQQVARTLLRHGDTWSDGETKLTVQLAKPKSDKQQTANPPQPSD